MRRLAEAEPTDLPLLSVYLDMRPQATGESPGRRISLTILRDRLSKIEDTLGPRGDAVDSFHTDAERIRAFLDDAFDRSAQGLALFACQGADPASWRRQGASHQTGPRTLSSPSRMRSSPYPNSLP